MLLKRKLQETGDYITKIISAYMTDGVTVLSISASLVQKISVATGCLYQIVLNR